MQRLYDFLRRHPTGVDSFWAVLFFGVSMLNVSEESALSTGLKFAAVPVVLALSTAVALRRKWTQAMFWLTLAPASTSWPSASRPGSGTSRCS